MNTIMDIDEICSICTENYDDSVRKRISIPCGHTICWSCMLDTFKSSNKCPFCRQKLNIIINKKDDEQEEEEENNNYNLRFVVNNKLYTINPHVSLLMTIISLGLLLIH